ncbi:MAG: methyltransferase domain-containing protein [Candidatus Omnitrophica bacterium]|nr:methyltransferase domain-containing protein [Candidatus Omnitrophota bacterium]
MEKKILDIGCGNNKIKDAIGLDIDEKTRADIIWDLNKYPYPIEDNKFDKVYAKHIIEHVDDSIEFMKEVYRITKPNGICFIETPHFSCYVAYSEPQHKRYFSYFMIDEILKKVPFKIIKREITFYKTFRLFGIKYLANKYPRDYERFWTYLFPAENVTMLLKKLRAEYKS